MSLFIKTEAYERASVEPIPVIDLVDSSDDDENEIALVTSKRDEITQIKQPARPRTPDTHCSICLEELTNKCCSNSCWHWFCFGCLKRWSSIDSSCPLCKKDFTSIYHSFTDEGLHETYEVSLVQNLRIALQNAIEDAMLPERAPSPDPGFVSRITDDSTGMDLLRSPIIDLLRTLNPDEDDVLHMRMLVYIHNVWAQPLPDFNGRFRVCSTSFFRDNPAQLYRLYGFIVRDISIIRNLQRSHGQPYNDDISNDSVSNSILHSIFLYEIRDPYLVSILRQHLGDHTEHFCHELYNYASSPYDMFGYDRNVVYSSTSGIRSLRLMRFPINMLRESTELGPPVQSLPIPWEAPQGFQTSILRRLIPTDFINGPTIIIDDSDSETESVTMLHDVIVLSSEESDVEIVGFSNRHPIESMSNDDEPSTSSGIGVRTDPSKNRYNLRRRRLPPSAIDGLPDSSELDVPQRISTPNIRTARRMTLDSSSDDEGSLVHSSRANSVKTENVVYNKRSRKVKKSKFQKRKKRDDDSQSQVLISSRNRSYSSSSSSGSSSSSHSTDSDTESESNYRSVQSSVVL